MSKQDIDALKDKIKRLEANSMMPANLKEIHLKKLKDQLAPLEAEEGAGKSEPVKKPAPSKPKEAKAPKTKPSKKEKKAANEKTYKGKPMSEWDCDMLEKDFKERMAAREKAGKKKKTRSVIEKVASHVVHAAKQAITAVPVEKIKKNPEVYADKMEQVEEVTKTWFKAVKSIMGDLYDAEDVGDEMKDLRDFIKQREAKFNKD